MQLFAQTHSQRTPGSALRRVDKIVIHTSIITKFIIFVESKNQL